jgi:ketosteroid isomerase-like protein
MAASLVPSVGSLRVGHSWINLAAMTTTLRYILVYFCTAIISTAYAQEDKVSQKLLALHKKKFEWLIGRNYDSLMAVMDEKLLYIHSNGLAESRDDVMKNLKNEVISYTQSDVTESQVRLFGNSAIVTGKGAFAGKAKGTPFLLNLSYTEVYVQTNGKWKLVSRHACKI